MVEQVAWSDLETKGFVVVPSFFGREEIDALLDDFGRGAPASAFPYGFKLVSRRVLPRVWPRIEPALWAIRKATGLTLDLLNFLTMSHYIDTSRTERTSHLHQDFDLDYRLTRDHLNYLNFWIPIAKPDPERSNVTVIPFDALKARSEAAFERLVGSGGHRLLSKDGATNVVGNYGEILEEGEEDATAFTLDFDIEELAVTPRLAAGDLLLMRGDLVHRTQDASTARTAASIRVTCSEKTIHCDRVPDVSHGDGADPDARLYASLRRCFAATGRPTLTIREFLDFANGARPSPA